MQLETALIALRLSRAPITTTSDANRELPLARSTSCYERERFLPWIA